MKMFQVKTMRVETDVVNTPITARVATGHVRMIPPDHRSGGGQHTYNHNCVKY